MASSSVATTEFLKRERRQLRKKQVQEVVKHLEVLDGKNVAEKVKADVSAGYHLIHFPERQEFLTACLSNEAFDGFIRTLYFQYVRLVRDGFKGREKYVNLQVKWMEYVRGVLHDTPECHPTEWASVVEKAGRNSSDHHVNSQGRLQLLPTADCHLQIGTNFVAGGRARH